VKVAVLVALAALAVTGCGYHGSASGTTNRVAPTYLEISITVGGKEAPTKLWTLGCPPTGTLPDPASACRQLAAVDKPFAPVPKGVACTQLYGGPQVAEVRGTFQTHPVNSRFTRTNGCEIARWDKVRFLFPH
jgi:Subtilisin inhibitor-like